MVGRYRSGFGESFVEIPLPIIEGAKQNAFPFVWPTKCLHGSRPERVYLEVSLSHVPRNRKQASHDDGTTKGICTYALPIQGPLESLQKHCRLNTMGL